ncbi:MAG: 1-acyl-sn-glycerol-3-phosphate acyltransferase, partial [Verrucomicrobiae bacterium]|nr:1-acyl-sn-glycerol-3-phosphate acyltransferase [Verrucomicrobiae bacterium]
MTRFLSWLVWRAARLVTRLFYRIRVDGRQHLPETGGALLVCNHLSLIDGFILGTAVDRRVRFIMDEGYHRRPLIRWFARLMGVIPVSPTQRPRDLIRSLRTASDVIREGGVVGIFAEGQITRTGQMLPFRRGFERIMHGLDAPVIPVCLEGLWGSLFSFARERFLWKWPARIPYP